MSGRLGSVLILMMSGSFCEGEQPFVSVHGCVLGLSRCRAFPSVRRRGHAFVEGVSDRVCALSASRACCAGKVSWCVSFTWVYCCSSAQTWRLVGVWSGRAVLVLCVVCVWCALADLARGALCGSTLCLDTCCLLDLFMSHQGYTLLSLLPHH